MSSGDDDHLDRILEGLVSDELVVMMQSSPQQPSCLQHLLGVVLAPTNNPGSMAELTPRKGRTGELRGGGPC